MSGIGGQWPPRQSHWPGCRPTPGHKHTLQRIMKTPDIRGHEAPHHHENSQHSKERNQTKKVTSASKTASVMHWSYTMRKNAANLLTWVYNIIKILIKSREFGLCLTLDMPLFSSLTLHYADGVYAKPKWWNCSVTSTFLQTTGQSMSCAKLQVSQSLTPNCRSVNVLPQTTGQPVSYP